MIDYFATLLAFSAQEWRDIPGYEGIYQASSLGQIRSLGRMQFASDGRKPRYSRGRTLSCSVRRTRTPYQAVVLVDKDGNHRPTLVHSAIASSFLGPKPSDRRIVTDHMNGDSLDNRACNLRYCSAAENTTKQSTKSRPWMGTRRCKGKWQAYIASHGHFTSLGCYESREEALAVRVSKEKEFWGDNAPIRTIE